MVCSPSTNLLVGRDGGAHDCAIEYEQTWGISSVRVYDGSLPILN